MYNKLKQILYLIILILAPQINNPSSAPGHEEGFHLTRAVAKYKIDTISDSVL